MQNEDVKEFSRDIKIIRQSQSKLALDYLRDCGVEVSVEEFQRVVDIFVECCIKKVDGDLKVRVKRLDKWIEGKKNKVKLKKK
jgi:hypothetical protein